MTPKIETLYIKKGRRYHIWGNALLSGECIDREVLAVGQFRLAYCPAPGHYRYVYGVNPDHAAFLAAAEIARKAMEDAMNAAASSKPSAETAYTKEQLAIIKRFRRDMAAAGALTPSYWAESSATEIAQAGINAVIEAAKTATLNTRQN